MELKNVALEILNTLGPEKLQFIGHVSDFYWFELVTFLRPCSAKMSLPCSDYTIGILEVFFL